MTALDDLCQPPFHDASAELRARILSRLADTELFLALRKEPAADEADILTFDLGGSLSALACDAEDRLSAFLGKAVPYVAMPGRVLAPILAAEQLCLLVNPGQASEMLLDSESLGWLGQALDSARVSAGQGAQAQLSAPLPAVVAAVIAPLSQRLSDMAGLVTAAALCQAKWPDGRRSHALFLLGVAETHREALAKAMAEFFAFLPEIEGGLDVAFADAALPSAALPIEIAEPPRPEPAPKRDPNAPPRLR